MTIHEHIAPMPLYASEQWIGRRKEQEDVVLTEEVDGGLLAIVCDGMGGHRHGALSAKITAEAFKTSFLVSEQSDVSARLSSSLEYANKALHDHTSRDPMSGTTLLAIYVRDRELWWISVGDSPLYVWSHHTIVRLNEDHSMRPIADSLYRSGQLSLQTALRQRSILRSAVTGDSLDMVDSPSSSYLLTSDDVIIACSDGLQTWQEVLRKPALSALFKAIDVSVQELNKTILEQVKGLLEPTQDNVSFITIQIR